MRARLSLLSGLSLAACGAIGTTSASAAVGFGDSCAVTGSMIGSTVTTLSAPPGPIPLTAPISGVVTQLKVNTVDTAAPVPLPAEVKLLRSVSGTTFAVTHQAQININAGLGAITANVRMPVQAGERLALRGTALRPGEPIEVTLICGESEGTIGIALGADPAPGQTVEFNETASARTPVSAVIEPDADNDGFGDETQDKCPTSAAVQVACPTVKIDSLALSGKSSVTIAVTVDIAAPVSVAATVKLGKGKPLQLRAPSKTVEPGSFQRFKLALPGQAEEQAEGTEGEEVAELKASASTTNAAGVVNSDKLTVKLKGQG